MRAVSAERHVGVVVATLRAAVATPHEEVVVGEALDDRRRRGRCRLGGVGVGRDAALRQPAPVARTLRIPFGSVCVDVCLYFANKKKKKKKKKKLIAGNLLPPNDSSLLAKKQQLRLLHGTQCSIELRSDNVNRVKKTTLEE
jgi:hypothetical protein